MGGCHAVFSVGLLALVACWQKGYDEHLLEFGVMCMIFSAVYPVVRAFLHWLYRAVTGTVIV